MTHSGPQTPSRRNCFLPGADQCLIGASITIVVEAVAVFAHVAGERMDTGTRSHHRRYHSDHESQCRTDLWRIHHRTDGVPAASGRRDYTLHIQGSLSRAKSSSVFPSQSLSSPSQVLPSGRDDAVGFASIGGVPCNRRNPGHRVTTHSPTRHPYVAFGLHRLARTRCSDPKRPVPAHRSLHRQRHRSRHHDRCRLPAHECIDRSHHTVAHPERSPYRYRKYRRSVAVHRHRSHADGGAESKGNQAESCANTDFTSIYGRQRAGSSTLHFHCSSNYRV